MTKSSAAEVRAAGHSPRAAWRRESTAHGRAAAGVALPDHRRDTRGDRRRLPLRQPARTSIRTNSRRIWARRAERGSTVVLENEHLRAVFLPELGGATMELFDKTAGKHLVHTGGAIHSPITALRERLVRLAGSNGTSAPAAKSGPPAVRCTPPWCARDQTGRRCGCGSSTACARSSSRSTRGCRRLAGADGGFRIRNPNGHAVPMYWWSNAAVPANPAHQNRRRAADPGVREATTTDGRPGRPTDEDGVDCTWPTCVPGLSCVLLRRPPFALQCRKHLVRGHLSDEQE